MKSANPSLLNVIFGVTRRPTSSAKCRVNLRPEIRRKATTQSKRPSADDPDFVSIVDVPTQLVSTRRKRGKFGIAVLALIPVTAFILGSWQVQRLAWKTDLIARLEDRLVRPPLPLPPRLDPSVIDEFDYRRVYATGKLRHDKEMLVGPRMLDGKDGYFVITPLEREDGCTVLINRGWISKDKKFQEDRDPVSLPRGEVTISGLLREPWKKNFFTPDNIPERNIFHFPDVAEMSKHAGSEAIWIEETMMPSLLESYDREAKAIPISRAPAVNLRNTHVQYIVTWYSLSAATAIMMWMVLKKKPSSIASRVKSSKEW